MSAADAARAGGRGSSPEPAAAQAGTDDAATPSLPAMLTAVLGAPLAWTLHLIVAYTLVGYACSVDWGGVRTALVVLTIVALVGALACGLLARRLWVRSRAVDRPTDDHWDARMGERTARVSFLMVMAMVMAGVFAIGILYQSAPVLLAQPCSAHGSG